MAEAHLGTRLSEETRRKIGDAGRGRKQSPETIERSRLARTGKPRTGAALANIVASNKSKWTTESRRKAAASSGGRPFTDEAGNLYYTSHEAAAALGVPPSKVRAVLNGTRAHTRGHTFRYVDET